MFKRPAHISYWRGPNKKKKKRGLAALSPERRREIARMGGQATAAKPGFLKSICEKGGAVTGSDRDWMSLLGRRSAKHAREVGIIVYREENPDFGGQTPNDDWELELARRREDARRRVV